MNPNNARRLVTIAPIAIPINIPVEPAVGNELIDEIIASSKTEFSPEIRNPLNSNKNTMVEMPKTIAKKSCFSRKNLKLAKANVRASTANKVDSTDIRTVLLIFRKNLLENCPNIPVMNTIRKPIRKKPL
jgi:hypothetical protein